MGGAHRPLVALLTDYGAGSEYVGALHLAIASRCPAADGPAGPKGLSRTEVHVARMCENRAPRGRRKRQ